MKSTGAGFCDLAKGELLFYQGDFRAAEAVIINALENAQKYDQHEIAHRALFYILRISVMSGNRARAEQVMNEMEKLLEAKKFVNRFITYDIVMGWYSYILRRPEAVPSWLKEHFAPYNHAAFVENFGNQMKARYCYLTKNFQPLLAYIEEMKQRESVFYGRIEMLAIEACVHYQMKDKPAAFKALREAYEAASPNNILMPFIELGKDMRTLASAALREKGCGIPKAWLEKVHIKSTYYAKYQAMLILDYENASVNDDIVALNVPETDILRDLCRGISKKVIAANRNMSVDSVKATINNIYEKLDAQNVTDVKRIAVERRLV